MNSRRWPFPPPSSISFIHVLLHLPIRYLYKSHGSHLQNASQTTNIFLRLNICYSSSSTHTKNDYFFIKMPVTRDTNQTLRTEREFSLKFPITFGCSNNLLGNGIPYTHTHTRHCDVISLDWVFTIIYIWIYSRRPSIVRKAFSFSDKRQSKRLIISIHMTWGYLNVKCHKHPYTHTRCDCESSNESALSGRFFFGERLTPG